MTVSTDSHASRRPRAQGVVDDALQRCRRSAAVLAVCGDHQLGLCIVDPGAQHCRGEAGEDDQVDQTQAGAREHRHDGFGNHRHVDGDSVTGPEPDLGEVVGRLADIATAADGR